MNQPTPQIPAQFLVLARTFGRWTFAWVYTVRGNLGSISSCFVSPRSLPHTTGLTKRLNIEPSGNLTKSFVQLGHGLFVQFGFQYQRFSLVWK